ncbi:MAG: SMP-30/gluconolactonase/LRE family protein [Bryobacteraceae bacterium]|nr:SMP-30/gluconolactonase/LRE family protein [Bryobacteraceae bacterium]MDW8377319.1 SMP-30/gluconolactonase/LRE family protein [Bryobacterales bacterium]
MRKKHLAVSLILTACGFSQPYTLGPDSERRPGVPQGSLTKHSWTSKIFPGTVRDYWVYVPAQYEASRPAAVMIFQDGASFVREDGAWRAPIVLDNLIHNKQMPVTIAIFINPGVLPPPTENQQARYNRSFEYDSVSDRYARFLLEEILPEVGKRYNLSSDPNDRGLAGSSSGAICAFTAAWFRPDQFRRVLSFIGSYVNLRGGHQYASWIRKAEPKPLRVFLQDGSNDLNIYAGHWFLGNQDLYEALKYAGYETSFVVGSEGHNSKHGAAILPDALRWLWKDHPKPIAKPSTQADRHFVRSILAAGSEWELVSQGHKFTEGPAADRQGRVFFTDIPNHRIYRIGLDGSVTVFKEDSGGANGLMFGPDGRLYACQNARKRIVAYTPDGAESVLAEGVNSNDLVVTHKGEIYFTDPPGKRVWFLDQKGNKRVVHEGIEFPNGIMLSPDQSLLTVADSRGKWVRSFQIQPDGSLAHEQPFYRLETGDDSSASGADGMTMDSEGFLYVATRLGVQICDQPGRVVAILDKPHSGPLSNVTFGGADRQTLFVTAGDRVYKRRLTRQGVSSWTIIKPPQPRL